MKAMVTTATIALVAIAAFITANVIATYALAARP